MALRTQPNISLTEWHEFLHHGINIAALGRNKRVSGKMSGAEQKHTGTDCGNA
jgi:hypothetical protein